MELSNHLVSWVVTYLGNLQPTYIGVIIYLLSTMDIPVCMEYLRTFTICLCKCKYTIHGYTHCFNGGWNPRGYFVHDVFAFHSLEAWVCWVGVFLLNILPMVNSALDKPTIRGSSWEPKVPPPKLPLPRNEALIRPY